MSKFIRSLAFSVFNYFHPEYPSAYGRYNDHRYSVCGRRALFHGAVLCIA